MKTTLFEVVEIAEHYGLVYTISLGLFQNQKDAREYFEVLIDNHPHGKFKLKVRTIH